jgi:hypothetical protein
MLISKFCHFVETLGATALAFINAMMKGTFIRYSKNEEEKKVLEFLTNYDVGDVVNLFRDISKRKISYIADFMGYPPFFMQEENNKKLLNTSCNTIKELLTSIGQYYNGYRDIYNAYKHGYRTIPATLNAYEEAIVYVKDDGEPRALQIKSEDIKKLLELSGYCRSILQDIFENHRLAMRISYTQVKNFTIRIYMKKFQTIKKVSLSLLYPPRQDKLKGIKREEKDVLRKIKSNLAEIFQVNGDYCLYCWQEITYPSI